MAGWKGFGDWLKKVQDSGYYFSDYDLQRAADDQNFADQAYGYKDTYAKATTQEEKDAAHAGMENLRAGTQYSGGADGSEYNPWEEKQENPLPSYIKETPKYSGAYDADIAAAKDRVLDRGYYASPYEGYIQEAVSKILNRDPFSYDLENDPSWAAYKKQYTREGQRAMQNTLGEIAARTGGVPSSYAVTAAQQANDYYMSQMADKIPELYKAAYAMYQNEGNDMLQRLSMLRGLDSDAYGRWGDEGDRLLQQLAMLQGLDDTEYSRWGDQRDYERKVYENDRNFDYETEQDRQARELALAKLGISLGGGYSGGYGGNNGGSSDAVTAFQNGDHSDAVIKALLDQGFTQADIEGSGYTGDYFSKKSGSNEKNAAGLGPRAQHVYETIMNQVVYGGSAADAQTFAVQEIEKGMANGSIDEDEADYILRVFGY